MTIAVLIMVAVIALVVGVIIYRRRPRKLNPDYFGQRWLDLQKHCASRKTWPLAIEEADALLDEALKKQRFKGKTTGERLVAAQHRLSSNESVWFGHKLRNRIGGEDVRKLKKQHVQAALNGFRQALRDLGALEHPKTVQADPEETA